jgi:hypothetical protein
MNASPKLVERPSGRGFVLAVVVPLGVVFAAYGLWWISDRLVSIGPLDRATFGWAVVIPVFVAAPVVAGFVWRRLVPRQALLAAGVVAAAIGGAAAILFWAAVAFPDCDFGAVRTPAEWVVPSLVLGAVIGGGLAASGLLASRLARDGRPWRAVIGGIGAEVAMVAAAILVGGLLLLGPGCQRPSIAP